MSSSLVVEYLDEVEEGHLGLAATEEMLPKLVLDRGEPALDDGVVVAVAPSAHAPGHAMRLKETLVVFAGIRTALIGVMQEPRGRLATFQCHPQRLDNQVTVVNSTYGPPNEESRVEVEERREIKLPAAADHELGRVPDPPLVRRIGDEVLPEHIGRDGLAMTAYRRALEAFAYSSNEAFCLFQPNHPLPTHSIPLLVQVVINPRTPIGAATRLMGGTNQHAQLAVPARVGRRRPTYPGIKATPRDVENLTQVNDRYGGLLRLDERESYSLSFAKKAAAFFKTSRSTRNRRFSLRSRRSSSRSTPVKPVRPFVRSARA